MAEGLTAEHVTFPSNGKEAHGHLVLPPTGSGPGVVVIQEWWGVTDHVRDVTERLAHEGFVAMAPDLFGGRTTHDADEAGEMMQKLPVSQGARDLLGAVDYLLGHEAVTSDRIGAVGFCMGGGFVLVLAAHAGERIGAAVPFYAVLQEDFPDLSGIAAPVLGHFGDSDDFAPPAQARALEEAIRRQAGVDVTFHTYPDAGHAFFNDENLLGTYHPEHARTAWERTVSFLRQHLGG